jgi:hypothetical protein
MSAMTVPEFEDFLRAKGLRAVTRIDEPRGIILVGETDWENDRPNEFPNGYYQTVYGLAGSESNGHMDLAQWLMFDAFHDMHEGWTPEEKRRKRIEATVTVAKKMLDINLQTGRYH